MSKIIITIDGPAGAGKGTIACYLAEKFSLAHLDSGLLYRAAALRILEEGIDLSDRQSVLDITYNITPADTKLAGLRSEEVASIASQIAVMPEVRLFLTDLQRRYADSIVDPYQGLIVDGRDCGTVVFPEAQGKIFVTARPEVRAKRRLLEVESFSGDKQGMVNIIHTRDERDASRIVAPLTAAKDACILDTSDLTIEEACEAASAYVCQVYLTELSASASC